MNLLHAKKDKLYIVKEISGDKLLHRRLLDMGFTPGTKIYVAGVAPMGGTILVGMRGILVALREDAASLILIERENSGQNDSLSHNSGFNQKGDRL